MAIKREELLQKRTEVVKKIEELEKENENVHYNCDEYLGSFGFVETMDKDDVCLAYKIMKDTDNSVDSTLSELGFEVKEEDHNYLGHTIDEWLNDLKTRAKVIRNEEKLYDLDEALDIIDANLSEDDRFSLEMEALEKLL